MLRNKSLNCIIINVDSLLAYPHRLKRIRTVLFRISVLSYFNSSESIWSTIPMLHFLMVSEFSLKAKVTRCREVTKPHS
jgi:hypothetical protein